MRTTPRVHVCLNFLLTVLFPQYATNKPKNALPSTALRF